MQQAFADLIQTAADRAGSHRALAKMLEVTPQRLNDWKAGRLPCPLHRQAQVAELAGVSAKEWVWGQICRQLGRSTTAVLLTLATSLAAIGAHGVAGGQGPARR